MQKENKEREYKLSRTVSVTKEEYIEDLKRTISHWERRAEKDIDEKISNYIKKAEKLKTEYLSYAARYRKELEFLEKSE